MGRPVTVGRARWLTVRAHLALLCGGFLATVIVATAVALVVQAVLDTYGDRWGRAVVALLAGFVGTWLLLGFVTVWSYRRHIGGAARSGDLALARRLAAVRIVGTAGGGFAGVDRGASPPNRRSRALESRAVLVGVVVAAVVTVVVLGVSALL